MTDEEFDLLLADAYQNFEIEEVIEEDKEDKIDVPTELTEKSFNANQPINKLNYN